MSGPLNAVTPVRLNLPDPLPLTLTVPEANQAIPADIAVGRTVTVRTLPNGTVVETIIVHKPE